MDFYETLAFLTPRTFGEGRAQGLCENSKCPSNIVGLKMMKFGRRHSGLGQRREENLPQHCLLLLNAP